MFLSSASAHAITNQSKYISLYISLNQLICQVYSPPFLMAASLLLPPSMPPTFALTYPLALFNPIPPFPSLISSFSQCQASVPLPLVTPYWYSYSPSPTPPQPSLLSLPDFHRLVCLRCNKSPSHKVTSLLFFFSFFTNTILLTCSPNN